MPGTVPRLKRRAEFLRVAGLRRKWAAPGLILQAAPALPPTGEPAPDVVAVPFRVGFTVSRKVGNSVTRNRAKRRLRAAVEAVLPGQARPGYDYVVIGRQDTVRRPFHLLLQDLHTALKRLGALRDDAGLPGVTADAAAPTPRPQGTTS